MTTSQQDREFLEELGLDTLLEQALDWIANHMSPEDVFKNSELEDWARNNGFVEEE